MGEQEAVVVELTPFNLHGVPYQDVTIAYRDRTVDRARLGSESVPDDLKVGEVVLAMRAANMVVGLRRP